MKLRNKKTGEIGYLIVGRGSDYYHVCNDEWSSCGKYWSLAELNEEWEDYEEPKEYWYINWDGDVLYETDDDTEVDKSCKAIGNYFGTKEEAEKAVEKLKAWKRLKDKGFKFNNWYYALEGNRENDAIPLEIKVECKIDNSVKDLDLLFGGEE